MTTAPVSKEPVSPDDENTALPDVGERVVHGNIAARIDRLPLLTTHFVYAGITQLWWGVMIAADGIVASLYPFLWAPQGLITSFQFDVLLGTNIGAGIMVGEYIGGYMSDWIGRRTTLVAAAIIEGLFIWPIAHTHSFWWLLLWNFLFALGMGMLLACNAVYLHEIAPPGVRQKLALRTQVIAPITLTMLAGVLAYYWMPEHYVRYLTVLSLAPIVILVPLGLFVLPESPRWLESKGHVSKADKIVSKWEARALARDGMLADPEVGRHDVVQTKHVPVKEVFTGQYAKETFMLWGVWFLGYSGMIYGFGSFFPTFAIEHVAWNAHQLFLWTRIVPLPFVILVFYGAAAFGERYERKTWALISGVLFSIVVVTISFATSNPVLITVTLLTNCLSLFWLFTMYNYTSAAYPTRLRSVGTGWTDGVGHLGAIVGTSLLVGRLFAWTLDSGGWGWIWYCAIPGALIPSLMIFFLGQRQKGMILEELSP